VSVALLVLLSSVVDGGGKEAKETIMSIARRANRFRGFTLIEVLVVVAIIALLISILLPSLAKAKEMCKRAACLANLHQQGLGLTAYAQDSKGMLPIRGFYGYNISEHLYLHDLKMDKNHPKALIKDPVNYGALYGKYIGTDLMFFYCPSIPKRFHEDPDYGIPSFTLHNDPDRYVTWGGYMYAAPVEVGYCPRLEGKQIYPSEIWHEFFIDEWVIGEKGYSDMKEYQKRMPYMQALISGGVIGGDQEGMSAIRATHGDGTNVLYSDLHAKFVNDATGKLGRLEPSSGRGGAKDLYTMWEAFSLQN